MSKVIAVLDDEEDIVELISVHLSKGGFKVEEFSEVESFFKFLDKHIPDLIILDLMLPDADGLEICKHLRAKERFFSVPIIMFTAKGEEMDKVLGLELGADDYITKPFSPRELVARVKAVLRRKEFVAESKKIEVGGVLEIDPDKFEVFVEGKKIEQYLNTLTDNLQNLAISLNLKILPALENGQRQYRELDNLIKKLGKDINTRITVVDAGGIVLADSERDPAEMENLGTRPEIMDAMKGETGKSLRLSSILKEEMLYVAIPVEKNGRILGVLRVSLFLRDINSLLSDLKNNIIKAAGFVTFVSLLLANVSHELRTPITAIKGFAETLLDDERDETSRHYLDVLLRHTDRLIKIVSDLLLLSKLEEKSAKLELEDVDPEKLLVNVVKLFEQRLREKNLNLRIETGADLPLIKADSLKLEQMFINLIDNAIKYTDKGEIRVSLGKRDMQITISVEDTGVGIPREHLEHIFEEFYVVDKSRSKKLGGTGLGLTIVKDIVSLHNGNISVEGIAGGGTKFSVVLPFNPGACDVITWSYVI